MSSIKCFFFLTGPRTDAHPVRTNIMGIGWGRSFLAGLSTAHMTAMFFVWKSNLRVIEKAIRIETNGYLSVPTVQAAATLNGLTSVACSGLFFSMTIGALLSLAGILLVEIGYSARLTRTGFRGLFTLFLIGFLWYINKNGLSWMPTVLFILVPGAVLLSRPRSYPRWDSVRRNTLWTLMIPLLILSAAWGYAYQPSIFVKFRDTVLLNNPIGAAVNKFYYDHTLSAAEIIKPLHQKSIRTFRWEHQEESDIKAEIQKILISMDYLPIPDDPTPDLTVFLKNEDIVLHEGLITQNVAANDFKRAPGQYLESISVKSDQMASLRRVLFVSILIGLPVLVYGIFFILLRRLSGGVFPRQYSGFAAGALCLAAGLALLWATYRIPPPPAEHERIMAYLNSDTDWEKTSAALDAILMSSTDIFSSSDLRRLLQSPFVAVRYRAAQALGFSKHIDAEKMLIEMIQDPQVNVACMAIFALGKRGNSSAIEPLVTFIRSREDWYRQWYAYRSLRKLGWHQKPSP
jgi:hypothetical protein